MARNRVHPKYEEAMRLLEQKVSGDKAARILGLPSATVRTWFWHVRKAAREVKVLKTKDDFLEALNRTVVRTVREKSSDGTWVEKTGPVNEYLSVDGNPRFAKAKTWVMKMFKDRMDWKNSRVPLDDDALNAAAAEFITKYNQERRLETSEYMRMIDSDEDLLLSAPVGERRVGNG